MGFGAFLRTVLIIASGSRNLPTILMGRTRGTTTLREIGKIARRNDFAASSAVN
jgi:hypothetical protein